MYKILANTIFLGKDIINLPDCHSTNDTAKSKIKSKEAAEGTIIITDHQTKGRGQRGNIWESQAGLNLTFSLVLSPHFINPMDQFNLNIIVSNAIHEVLSQYVHGFKIKWPNDIVHESNGKIAGVLIENVIAKNRLESAVIGIGLNINQIDFANSTATSLAKVSGNKIDKSEIFELLIKKIELNYIELKKGNFIKLKDYYMQNLFRFEEWALFFDKIEFKGKITAVGNDGRLIIEKEDGNSNFYSFKEVSFL